MAEKSPPSKIHFKKLHPLKKKKENPPQTTVYITPLDKNWSNVEVYLKSQ